MCLTQASDWPLGHGDFASGSGEGSDFQNEIGRDRKEKDSKPQSVNTVDPRKSHLCQTFCPLPSPAPAVSFEESLPDSLAGSYISGLRSEVSG